MGRKEIGVCRAVSAQKGMWINNRNWMSVEQNPKKKHWNPVEVEREIKQEGEECRAWERAGTMIQS